MPESYLDSVGDEIKWALAEILPVADGVLSLAHDLEVKLPVPGRCSGPGCCATPRSSSSPARRRCWTRTRPARPSS